MKIKHILMKNNSIKDSTLYKKYKDNIHDIELTESIQDGIADRLMNARELGIPYCVVFGHTIPVGTSWDPYGNGDWDPPRNYITTDDIATIENNREEEKQNIYSFLRGEMLEKEKGRKR